MSRPPSPTLPPAGGGSQKTTLALALAAIATACAPEAGEPGPLGETLPVLAGTPIEAEPQRHGDAEAGYLALVNEGYVSCGLPYSVYKLAFGPAPEEQRVDGREGAAATMPYSNTLFRTASGVEVVTSNCFTCHADFFDGQLVLGLGSHSLDFTADPSGPADLVGGLISDPAEKVEWKKWSERVKALAPYVQAPTRGVNVAENVTALLIAHRDRETLAWSNEPLLPLPPALVPVDVPPLWRMSKKHAMFYSGQGRGDHARIMMTASTLCTDSVADAEAIDAYFPDVRAYIASLEAPLWPWSIDRALASRGEDVFEATCARCHGSYGDDESYPNLLIALGDVGTDPVLATASTHLSDAYIDWFNGSFYGEIARVAPNDGYVAPPLDGVWATAPYLHNGSVPTLAALLDSRTRPGTWRRSFDSKDYDQAALGWRFDGGDGGKTTYDTTRLGYSNQGHTFGDGLGPDARIALLEYIKTL